MIIRKWESESGQTDFPVYAASGAAVAERIIILIARINGREMVYSFDPERTTEAAARTAFNEELEELEKLNSN